MTTFTRPERAYPNQRWMLLRAGREVTVRQGSEGPFFTLNGRAVPLDDDGMVSDLTSEYLGDRVIDRPEPEARAGTAQDLADEERQYLASITAVLDSSRPLPPGMTMGDDRLTAPDAAAAPVPDATALQEALIGAWGALHEAGCKAREGETLAGAIRRTIAAARVQGGEA